MTSVRTFITALQTGETKTTIAAQAALGRGRRVSALVNALNKRGAFDSPLQPAFRDELRRAKLSNRDIEACIDRWPDAQKERMRRAVASAVRDGRKVRIRWGLTTASSYETQIRRTDSGLVTITALSPRRSLRVSGSRGILVGPADGRKRRT
jgi:hypothetical protein